jgi:hypothetical protein
MFYHSLQDNKEFIGSETALRPKHNSHIDMVLITDVASDFLRFHILFNQRIQILILLAILPAFFLATPCDKIE